MSSLNRPRHVNICMCWDCRGREVTIWWQQVIVLVSCFLEDRSAARTTKPSEAAAPLLSSFHMRRRHGEYSSGVQRLSRHHPTHSSHTIWAALILKRYIIIKFIIVFYYLMMMKIGCRRLFIRFLFQQIFVVLFLICFCKIYYVLWLVHTRIFIFAERCLLYTN